MVNDEGREGGEGFNRGWGFMECLGLVIVMEFIVIYIVLL